MIRGWPLILTCFYILTCLGSLEAQDSSDSFDGDKGSFDYLLYLFEHDKDIGIRYGHLSSRYKNRIPDQLAKQYLNRDIPDKRQRGYYTGQIKLETDQYYGLFYESPCHERDVCRTGFFTTVSKEGEPIDHIIFSYDTANRLTYDTMNSRIIQQTLIEQVIKDKDFKPKGEYHQYLASDTTRYRYYDLSESGTMEKIPLKEFTGKRMFPFTSHRLVQPNELKFMSTRETQIMKYEIFADYGFKFKAERWKEYFENKDWYEPKKFEVFEDMNIFEKWNVKRILKYQR